MAKAVLQNYLHARTGNPNETACRPYFKTSRLSAAGPSGNGLWQTPDLCAAYGWPTGLTGGGVIALVELAGGWVQSDIDAYFQSIGQPSPRVVDVSVDGTQNTPNQSIGDPHDPDIEVALDIEVAGAAYYAATGQPATIKVYWAANSDAGAIAAAIRKATADKCDVCSISWGSDEANWQAWGASAGKDFLQDLEAAATAAVKAGMVVFAATGDNDSGDGGATPANVDAPSSCPHVVACGGTSKTVTTEAAWNNNPGSTNGEGTGGGFSTVFPVQAFQARAPAGPGRMVPDVSADADPQTGYWMFVHGAPLGEGGTSAVAPLYAGLFAAFGVKLGFVTPTLWANQLCFNDITQGDNGFYRAGPGPDPCSGIGSPIGTKLSALLLSGSTSAQVASGRSAATPGWSGTVTYTYRDGILVNCSSANAPG